MKILVPFEFEAGRGVEKGIEPWFLNIRARSLVAIPTELPGLRTVAVDGLINEFHSRFDSDVTWSRATLEILRVA
jgi:hypothetical protein